MASVGRVLVSVGAVAVAAALLLIGGLPAAPAAADAAGAVAAAREAIGSYDTRIEVRPDGRIRVTETIAYDFGADQRHGIIRRIPAVFRYDGTHDRVYPIADVEVTVDGGAVAVERSTDGGDQVFRIGNPDRTITGTHTYVIAYTVDGVLNHFAGHEELYWNAVGHEWPTAIADARVTVTGPATIERVECFAGPSGSRLGCEQKANDGATATFRHSGLTPGSGLSVVVALPVGSVSGTGPILVERRDLTTAFRVTPATVGGAVGLALAGLVAALLIAWRVGRDRRYVGQLPGLTPGPGQSAAEERKPLFGAPPVSVEFGPPERIRPGQVGTLIDERAHVLDVTATIVDFAVRRHLHIRELSSGSAKDWELTKLTEGDRAFRGYESALFRALFRKRDRVRLSQLRHTFARDLQRVRQLLYADMVDQGWYRQSPQRTRTVARTIAVGVLVAAVVVTVALAVFTQVALVGLGLIAGAVALLVVAGRFPARTGRGSAALARVQGFRLYIATAEAEQIKFLERENVFSEFLPYAIVFGLTGRWARVFADLGTVEPSDLYWYGGMAGATMAQFERSMARFTTTTSGVVAASPPSTPSSSGVSGFGGGGFSGGGAGGGGGGSW
jgi:hypothetical protein